MRLEWSRDDDTEGLRLVGVDAVGGSDLRELTEAELARRFPVYPSDLIRADGDAPVPIAAGGVPQIGGRYSVDADGVRFVPRYEFLDRTSYTMLVHRSIADPRVPASHFDVEDFEQLAIARGGPDGARTTHVVEIYPTSAQIPRNQLKLYLHFSRPMSDGQIADRVSVRRADTRELLVHAFLPMEPELWDPKGQRATVLFDPARIKRGLAPHREIGYPLEVGVPVEVVVDECFRDADGRELVTGYERRYDVGADVRSLVDPARWRTTGTKAGTTEPLEVAFDRPLDHTLLEHCLRPVDADGRPVAGRARIGAHEGSWSFRPDASWASGAHRLLIDALLEDLAGNSVARVFDRELARPEHRPLDVDRVSLELPST